MLDYTVVRIGSYLLSVGVMLPLMAVLSAAWIDVDPVSCTTKSTLSILYGRESAASPSFAINKTVFTQINW